MKNERTGKDVLQRALEMLQKQTGLVAAAEVQLKTVKATSGPDALIRIVFQGLEWNFAAAVENTLTRATLGGAVQQLRKFTEKGLLLTRYVTPQMAEELKEMNIPFMDTAGNAYIYDPPLCVFIKGNKPVDDYRKDRPTRAFQPRGLQVVFAFLCKPGLEHATYREIAKEAAVALGTVNWVMTDLKQMGYLIDMGKRGRRLVQKESLLAQWVTAYPQRLRPRKILGRYRAPGIDWWKNTEIDNFRAYWGGEVAAAMLTEYLKPHTTTIYTTQALGELLLKNRMRKDPHGDVEILEVFWEFEYNWPHPNLVPPLLIYADLLATGDPRNIETAEIVYEKELTRFIRED